MLELAPMDEIYTPTMLRSHKAPHQWQKGERHSWVHKALQYYITSMMHLFDNLARHDESADLGDPNHRHAHCTAHE